MGDTDFERELVDVLPFMDKFARLYLRRGDDRSEVVQEAALRAWASRHQFRGDGKFSSWVYTIIRNVILEIRRKHNACGPHEVPMSDFFEAVDEKQNTARDDWPIIEKLLPTLPKHLQGAIDIHLNGLDAGPTSTNRVRYHRAILILRARLGEQGKSRPSQATRERDLYTPYRRGI